MMFETKSQMISRKNMTCVYIERERGSKKAYVEKC